MLNIIFRKDDLFFLKKKLVLSRGAPQENDAKFRFASHPQGIERFHDNYQIAKCQTVAQSYRSSLSSYLASNNAQ